MNRRLVALGLIALAAPAASRWCIRALPVLHRAELLVYDWHAMSLTRLPPDNRIVVVGMDQESLGHLPIERQSYPLPRSVHARVVRMLHEAGAIAVAFDLTFSLSIPAEDREFAAALRASGPTLCGTEPHVRLVDGDELVTFTPPAEALRPYLTACSILAPPMLGRFRWFMPETIDAVAGTHFAHLSVALAEALGGSPTRAPRGGDGEILIRFAGPPNTYRPVPLYQVYDGSFRERVGPDAFRGKAVLIGVIDPLVDRALTPVGDMPGVEVLAQAAQTVLQENWIRHFTEAENAALAVLLCLALTACVAWFGFRWAFWLFAAEAALWMFAAHRLFELRQVWADTVEPVAAMALAVVTAGVYEAGRVRRVFRRFMPSEVAERMLQAHPEEAAATREISATVVFCDVRGSTQLAESLSSERVEQLLKRYFVAGEDAARRLGTELDKFVGDEIMLYFEERPEAEHHALRAVRWAFAMHQACESITESGLAGDLGFRVGVGISTGVVRLGIVGARQRIQHTVIGDAVNTASRLQALTKDLRQPTILGESTWEQVRNQVDAVLVGEVSIRGKAQPMNVYAPVRLK